jgi:hypothetical protein
MQHQLAAGTGRLTGDLREHTQGRSAADPGASLAGAQSERGAQGPFPPLDPRYPGQAIERRRSVL